MHEDFIDPSGELVERPWLQIEALSHDTGRRIGVGVQKAKAVCAVANHLREWVAYGDALKKRATIHLKLANV
jgi:hypothetical protein